MSKLFRDVEGTTPCPQGSVVCIGAFDGLHLGHQALVRRARLRASALGVPAVALSFEPLPREFFGRADPPPRLLLPAQKALALRDAGMDHVGLLRFGAAMAAWSPAEFIERVLVRHLRALEVWVGPGFAFGRGRAGSLETLHEAGARHGFSAQAIDAVAIDGVRVSSSRIREALVVGELPVAASLLGRPYAITGRVVRGKQLGRTLGYPTANIRFHGKRPALWGIYATRVHGIGDTPWSSVSSLGTRPTVAGKEPLLEAHLFDFDGDLYGRRLTVEFVAKLRDEVRFDGLPALIEQMHCDAAQARAALDPNPQKRKTPS